jgi:hypothetical protein
MEDIDQPDDSALQNTNLVANAPIWTGGVDALNGAAPFITSENRPLKVVSGERLEIQGWAASKKTGEAFESVYAILGNQRFRALVAVRPDVAQYFQNPRLGKAGFDLSVDASIVPKGRHVLRLVGVTRDSRIYRYPGEIYVFVQ